MYGLSTVVKIALSALAALALGFGLLIGGAIPSQSAPGQASSTTSLGNPYDIGSLRMAVSESGQVIAFAWVFFDGSSAVVRTRFSTDGGQTFTSMNLSDKSEAASQPALAVSDSGTMAFSWRTSADPDENAQVTSKYTTDGGQSWVTRKLSDSGELAGNATVAMGADGMKIYYMYRTGTGSYDEEDDQIDFDTSVLNVSSSIDNGNSWNDSEVTAQDEFATDGSVSVSKTGSVVVYTWYDANSATYRASYSPDGGTSWSVADLNSPGTYAYGTGTALSADGQTIAHVWTSLEDAAFTVQSRYTVDGGSTWIQEQVSEQGNNDANNGQVSVDNSGQTMLYTWATPQSSGNFPAVNSRYTTNSGQSWENYDPTEGADSQQLVGTLSGDGQTWSYAWINNSNKFVNKSRYTKNAGQTWSTISSMSDPSSTTDRVATVVDATGGYIGYGWTWKSGTAKAVVQARYSTNQGENWAEVNLSGSSAVKKAKSKSVTSKSAMIQWKKPGSIDSAGVKKYEVRYKKHKSNQWKSWAKKKPKKLKVSKGKFAKNLKKLKPGKKYLVQVRTKNSISPGGVAELSFKTAR